MKMMQKCFITVKMETVQIGEYLFRTLLQTKNKMILSTLKKKQIGELTWALLDPHLYDHLG